MQLSLTSCNKMHAYPALPSQTLTPTVKKTYSDTSLGKKHETEFFLMLFLVPWTLRQHEEVLNPLQFFEVLLVEIQVMRHVETSLLGGGRGMFFFSFHKNNWGPEDCESAGFWKTWREGRDKLSCYCQSSYYLNTIQKCCREVYRDVLSFTTFLQEKWVV